MAVGTTEALGSSQILRFSADQRRIAVQTISVINNLGRGVSNAKVNPSEAIPPSGDGQGQRDASPGIGSRLDLQA